MHKHVNLGMLAITAVMFIAGMVAMLAPAGTTGLFAENNGNCKTILGGVKAYVECSPEFEDNVDQWVGFPQRYAHTPFYAKQEQQFQNFDTKVYADRIVLEHYDPIYGPGQVNAEGLATQQFSRETYASRRYLQPDGDPYAGSPYARPDEYGQKTVPDASK